MGGQVVLITGASGFIGRRLRDALSAQGDEVLSLRRPASPPAKEGRSVEAAYDDLPALTEIMKAERPAVIYHVAGVTKGVSYEDFTRGNLMPTENLIEACKQAGHTPARFVHISSLAAYGPAAPGAPLNRDSKPKPIEYYGKSKLEAEQAVERGGLPYTIIRPSGVYGPGDVDYFELFKMADKGFALYFGNRKRRMSMIYVDDLVEAILKAASHPGTVDKGYFICDGAITDWQRFQALVDKAVGKKVRAIDLPGFVVHVAARFGELASSIDKKPRLFNRQKAIMGDQDAWTCSPEAATEDFGFTAATSQEEGAEKTLAWYRENKWL